MPTRGQLGALEAFVTKGDPVPVKADVVLDSAGSPTWSLSTRALKPGGRLVTCGGTGGVSIELNLARLFLSQQEVIGSTMGTFREFDEVTALVSTGLPVVVDSVYELDQYPSAAEAARVGGSVRQGRAQALTVGVPAVWPVGQSVSRIQGPARRYRGRAAPGRRLQQWPNGQSALGVSRRLSGGVAGRRGRCADLYAAG